MKNRLVRVRELLKRELGEILNKEFDFENALVTINEVDVTPDLRQGHVYVGILGEEQARSKVMEKLNSNRGLIQKRLSSRVVLKFTPQLHFKEDNSIERGVRIVQILEEIETEEQSRPEHGGTDAPLTADD